MSGLSAAFLAERGLGPVEDCLRLAGRAPVGAGEPARADLCLTPQGAYVVAAKTRFIGEAWDVGEATQVKYEPGRLRDRLGVGTTWLPVPAGRGGEARRLVALGRVRKSLGSDAPSPPPPDRYCGALPSPAWEAAASGLGPEETLIAALSLGVESRVRSELGPVVAHASYLVLTAERARCVGLSELGDLELVELDPNQTRIETEGGHAELRSGARTWSIAEGSAAVVAELIELLHRPPGERLYAAARRLWLSTTRAAGSERAEELLLAAAARGHARAPAARALIRCQIKGPRAARGALLEVGRTLASTGPEPEILVRIWRELELSPETGRDAMRSLRELGAQAEPWALELHRAVHSGSTGADATADHLEMAEHELIAGDPTRARSVCDACLATLAPDEDAVLDPGKVSRAHSHRIRLQEIRAREALARGETDVGALAALTGLEPLNAPRLQALAQASASVPLHQRLVRRAREALACLEPGGLMGPIPPSQPRSSGLDEIALREQVAHPLARGSGRLAGKLSELVASVPEPDLGFLRDFCEELSEERQPDAARALANAGRLLSMPSPKAYVSHGARSVGLRVFGTTEPFILIGASHLTPNGRFSLSGRELDFAFAAELGHLAFGHQRVTAGEVWAGATGKARDALLALSVVLPLVSEVSGLRNARILRHLGPETLKKALLATDKLERLLGSRKPETTGALSQNNEELISAHRLVQLTADRAGLVAAACLPAALRAVLLTRSDYRTVLDAAETRDLVSVLREPERSGPGYADLLVRIRAMVAFYLSPDFDALTPEP